ncbi:hypothetical protein BD408DRAFT_425929 [Parasitella parasitica]|nr:hypothetical protein BD408DRAFT_425929 [Parasitella parasitica]
MSFNNPKKSWPKVITRGLHKDASVMSKLPSNQPHIELAHNTNIDTISSSLNSAYWPSYLASLLTS